MPTPRADTYSMVRGNPFSAGRAGTPTWLANKPLNTWFQIPGTSGAAGARLNNFNGLGRQGTKWVSAAADGHGGGLDNRVVAIDLSADSPAWVQLKAASISTSNDTAYYPDGKPAARHTYSSIFGISGNRIIIPGVRFTYPGAASFNAVDAFDLTTNQWVGVVADSPGTSGSGLASVSPAGYFPVVQDHNGDLWCVLHSNGNVAKYTVATNTWSQPVMANKVASNVRYPWALDTSRNQLFGLAWGDGEGADTGIRAVQLDYAAGTQRSISFSAGSSGAVSQFSTDAAQYAGMDYDPINDRFIYYSNGTGGRVYLVTPNSGTTWDMSILTGAGSLPVSSSPLIKKLAYFPTLKTVVVMPEPEQNLYAMRLGA